jgi:hypothetical protein
MYGIVCTVHYRCIKPNLCVLDNGVLDQTIKWIMLLLSCVFERLQLCLYAGQDTFGHSVYVDTCSSNISFQNHGH